MKARISINGKRIEKYFDSKSEADIWLSKIRETYSDPSLLGEIWTDIPGFSRYKASNLGRLRSENYKKSGLIKVLKPSIAKDGYLKTMLLSDSGGYKSWTVHKFITLAFYGSRPVGNEVNHIDGDKLNNAIDNLEYCTHAENCQHAVDNKLWKPRRGELNGMSKLTLEQVQRAIKAKNEKGRFWGRNELAKEFGVTPKHLQKVVNDINSWKIL